MKSGKFSIKTFINFAILCGEGNSFILLFSDFLFLSICENKYIFVFIKEPKQNIVE